MTDAGVVGIRYPRGAAVALPFGTALRAVGFCGPALTVKATIAGRRETLEIHPSQAAGIDAEPDRRNKELAR